MPWWARPATWVLVVAVGYGLSQLLLLDVGRFLSWDEAVYASEVSPFAEAVGMGAHRSRGMTLIVAPVVTLTDSMPPLRVYLAVVASAAMFGSFVVWCRTIGWGAPVAAALFASSWLTIHYGSTVYPNLYSASLAVAVIGLAIRPSAAPALSRMSLLAGLVALAAVIRLPDALVLIACLVVVGLTARRNTVALALAGLIGFGLGALAWAVEAWARFGGPLQRLETARGLVGGGIRNNVSEYLRLLDGDTADVSVLAVVWLGLLLVLGLVGLVGGDRSLRRVSLVSLASSALLAAPYLFGAEVAVARFMLPALALLCIASGLGVTALVSAARARPVAVAGTAVVVLLIMSWNIPTVRAFDARQSEGSDTALVLGEAIRERSATDQCFFLSPFNYPAISFASGCQGRDLSESIGDNRRRAGNATEAGSEVFAITNRDDPGVILGDGWLCEPVEPLADRDWKLCTLVAHL